jgi:uncharacterized membrane protein
MTGVSSYEHVVTVTVQAIEAVGALIMVVGGAVVMVRYVLSALSPGPGRQDYHRLRSDLGRVILLGLEVLIVADIVRTIIVEPSLTSVGALGTIVLIRTILSFSLDIEIDGELPWRRGADRTTG